VKRNLYVLLSLLALASLTLAACGGGAPATEGPAPTEAPETAAPPTEAPTEAPTEVPAEPTPIPDVPIATFDGTTLSVPAEECNGDYVGIIQSIEATDQYTVTFNLCKSDPPSSRRSHLAPSPSIRRSGLKRPLAIPPAPVRGSRRPWVPVPTW